MSALPAVGVAAPAQAAVPGVAQTWSSLMYRSLTRELTAAQLRSTLTTQQATLATRDAAVRTAETAGTAAQTRLATAIDAEAGARARLTAAQQARLSAKRAVFRASQQRPRSAAAVQRATKAVTLATGTVNTRRAQADRAAAGVRTALAAARTAAAGLTSARAASASAAAAITQTRQKLTVLPAATALAGQAAALSRDVVTQVRPTFTVADTTTVYGSTVHKNIAYAFRRMVDDAKADGVVMSAGGFRTKQRQIELRTINGCPDVWTAPASSCRVPTAIPGRSLHEVGLAVDITAGGRTITAKSPAFAWLKLHAAEYGFVNLPSEAWHWSITGG